MASSLYVHLKNKRYATVFLLYLYHFFPGEGTSKLVLVEEDTLARNIETFFNIGTKNLKRTYLASTGLISLSLLVTFVFPFAFTYARVWKFNIARPFTLLSPLFYNVTFSSTNFNFHEFFFFFFFLFVSLVEPRKVRWNGVRDATRSASLERPLFFRAWFSIPSLAQRNSIALLSGAWHSIKLTRRFHKRLLFNHIFPSN